MTSHSDAAVFSATYSDWRLIRGRKCVQIVFELPLEHADGAYAALGGMPNPAAEAWFAIARLVQPARREVGAETTEGCSQPESALPARAPRNKLTQLAGMLSKDPLFHKYIDADSEERAAAFVRGYCSVESRSDIAPDTPAGEAFIKLYDQFALWRDKDAFVEAANNFQRIAP